MHRMATIAFSQRDPRWSGETLGTGSVTIGRVGCLLTASAAMLATWGVDTDPHRLNQWLIANRGYADGNLMVFSALKSFGVHFVAYINCATVPAPMTRLIEDVQGGAGVLACVDWQPGNTLQTHWVHVTGLDNEDGQITDPWQLPGREFVNLATYLAPGGMRPAAYSRWRSIAGARSIRWRRFALLPQRRSRRKSRAISSEPVDHPDM